MLRIFGKKYGKKKTTKEKTEQNVICVLCKRVTDVKITIPIEERTGFVAGAGQLCGACYREVYQSLSDDVKRYFI